MPTLHHDLVLTLFYDKKTLNKVNLLAGADPRVILPAGNAGEQQRLPARAAGLSLRRRDPAALGLLRRGVREDKPDGVRVRVRQLPVTPMDRPHLWIQTERYAKITYIDYAFLAVLELIKR